MMLLRLFLEFFQIGLFSFGGGMATLPFLYDMGARTAWFTAEDVTMMIAVSESTPGPIGVNMATYVGFRLQGIPGGIVATLALVLPAFLIILIIARFLKNFQEKRLVQDVFYGLRPASTALIATAGMRLLQSTFWVAGAAGFAALRWECLLLAAVLLPATRKLRWHPVVFLGFSALVGIVFQL